MDPFTILINISMTVCIIGLTLIVLYITVVMTVEPILDWRDKSKQLDLARRTKGEKA